MASSFVGCGNPTSHAHAYTASPLSHRPSPYSFSNSEVMYSKPLAQSESQKKKKKAALVNQGGLVVPAPECRLAQGLGSMEPAAFP